MSLEQPQNERSDKWWGVVCRSTKNLGGTCAINQIPSRTKQAAIKRWNTRAKTQREKELEDRVEELESIIHNDLIKQQIEISKAQEELGLCTIIEVERR